MFRVVASRERNFEKVFLEHDGKRSRCLPDSDTAASLACDLKW